MTHFCIMFILIYWKFVGNSITPYGMLFFRKRVYSLFILIWIDM
jgi:hypothetical protein